MISQINVGMKEDAIGPNSIFQFGGGEHERGALERAQRFLIDKLERKVSSIRSSLVELCSKMNISRTIQVSTNYLTFLFRF